MNIIFLDIDGVLNHHQCRSKLRQDFGEVCEDKVAHLNKIVAATGAKIVVSSTWRKDSPKWGTVAERLKNFGVVAEFLDDTPELNFPCALRGNEILAWMKQHEDLIGKYYDFHTYIILDDDSDMLYWQKDNYLNIDHASGLTESTVYKAIRLFSKLNNITYEY